MRREHLLESLDSGLHYMLKRHPVSQILVCGEHQLLFWPSPQPLIRVLACIASRLRLSTFHADSRGENHNF